ncbi:MAG: tetratricopeptide repeat protein [Gemmatimonadetes bacterium]|nr:tetratricopeptide repeat protein [Gemmatimonadota bacterium]NIO30391.1 tetratricopeptide repeat protein [Gemmatimonadota bacterium]
MSAAARHRQRARAFEQRENWKRAIEEYEAALEADKLERGRDVDLALYNRIGDLYRRVGNVNRAVHYYELAADGHLAAGFYNNAIALCNKILRNQPNRHSAYLKLGKIGAAKGFLSDARRHFLEYAERMQRSGQLDAAFSALMEFADLSPDPEVRLMIADQLIEHDRTANAVEQLRLAWRDLTQEGRDGDAQEVRGRIMELAPERDPEVHPPEEESTSSATDAVGVIDLPEILPWGDEPEPEPEPEPPPRPEPVVADEPVMADEPDLDEEPGLGDEPVLTEEPVYDDEALAEPLQGLELTSEMDTEVADIDLGPGELDMEGVDIDADSLQELEQELFGPEEPAEPPLDITPTALDHAEPAEPEFGQEPPSIDLEQPPATDWVEPAPAAPAPEQSLEPPAPPVEERVTTPEDRIAELEARLQIEGDQPDTLFDLAEALLETGVREKASVCLAQALEGYEQLGRFTDAGRVLDEMLRLDVNDVRAYQKRVELALRAGDGPALVDAYLALADCLDRSDASNKARAVYARVLELDPRNGRAAAALEMFVEEEAAPAAPASQGQAAADYVDLGSLVAEEEKATRKSTRFKIAAADPQSESDVNFAEMLSQFKSKVAEAIEEEDAASHYDLGCAFRDMGLLDEAIAEFQIAARGLEFRLRAIEMLGACFVEKGDHRIALKVLNRALQVPGHKDEELVGIFYAMGRSYEDLGETEHALEWYERVMGCDMNFMDVGRRVSALRP